MSEAGLPYRGNLVAVILLTAGCSLVYELAIGTLSTYLMGDSALQFSLTIGVFLAAMGAGAWFAREPGPDPLARLVRIEIAVAVLGGLSGFLLHGAHAVLLDGYTPAMIAVLAVLGTLVGMELPLLAELLRRAGGVRGVFASALAVDYLGALLGSLAFPLALLPMLGTVKAALAAGAVNLVAVTLLLPGLAGAARRRAQLAVAVAGVLIVLAGAWAGQVVSHFEHRLYRDEVLHAETSRFQRIVVTRWRDDLRLYADRELQFSSRDEHRYHEALVHPALAAVSRPERVLVIGGGDGLAVREVLKHPQVVEVVLVDIDPAMTALGRDFPPLVELNRGALADPRVRIDHRDGFAYLREADAGYDVIILDLPDPRTEDLGRLYTLEFYRLAVRALGADGVLATQATSPYYARETFWTIEATLAAAGLATVPYRVHVPAFAEWGFVLGARRPMDPATLRLDLPARWLDVGQFRAALAFDRDTARLPDLPASTLEAPWAWRHYRERTRYWRAGP